MSMSGSQQEKSVVIWYFFIGCSRNQFACFVQFIHLFHCQSGLRYHVSAALREAVVKGLVVADADHVSDFVPVVVRVQTVAGLRLLGIIQPSVTTGELIYI